MQRGAVLVLLLAAAIALAAVWWPRAPAATLQLASARDVPERRWDEVHLLVQWHRPASAARLAEYERAQRRNLANAHLTHIHFLQGTDDAADGGFEPMLWRSLCDEGGDRAACRARASVHYLPFTGRLSAQTAFRYAATHLRGRTCMLANLDIFFDESLALLTQPGIDLGLWQTYFLSRYEEDEAAHPSGTQCGPRYIGSHDTVVFVPPLPTALVERCDFVLGTWGIENRLMWEFERAGVAFRNPCVDVRSWHVHRSQYKSEWMPMVNDDNRSAVAHPARLRP